MGRITGEGVLFFHLIVLSLATLNIIAFWNKPAEGTTVQIIYLIAAFAVAIWVWVIFRACTKRQPKLGYMGLFSVFVSMGGAAILITTLVWDYLLGREEFFGDQATILLVFGSTIMVIGTLWLMLRMFNTNLADKVYREAVANEIRGFREEVASILTERSSQASNAPRFMYECSVCGTPALAEASFCWHCGEPFTAVEE